MIVLSDSAKEKIRGLIAEENDPNARLRVFVQGGGCSGMQYGFTFDSEINEDDHELEFDGVKLLIDSMSGQYLSGAEISWIEDIYGSSFSIKNPNADTTCGCGSSFFPN